MFSAYILFLPLIFALPRLGSEDIQELKAQLNQYGVDYNDNLWDGIEEESPVFSKDIKSAYPVSQRKKVTGTNELGNVKEVYSKMPVVKIDEVGSYQPAKKHKVKSSIPISSLEDIVSMEPISDLQEVLGVEEITNIEEIDKLIPLNAEKTKEFLRERGLGGYQNHPIATQYVQDIAQTKRGRRGKARSRDMTKRVGKVPGFNLEDDYLMNVEETSELENEIYNFKDSKQEVLDNTEAGSCSEDAKEVLRLLGMKDMKELKSQLAPFKYSPQRPLSKLPLRAYSSDAKVTMDPLDEIKNKIETEGKIEKILDDEYVRGIQRVRGIEKVKQMHEVAKLEEVKKLEKIKEMVKLNAVKEVEKIEEIKKMQEVANIQDIKDIKEVKSKKEIKSMEPIINIQEVKQMIPLTQDEAEQLLRLAAKY